MNWSFWGGIIFTLLNFAREINELFISDFNHGGKMRCTIFVLCFLLLGSLHVSTINEHVLKFYPTVSFYEAHNDWSWEMFLTGNFGRPQFELSLRQKKFNWLRKQRFIYADDLYGIGILYCLSLFHCHSFFQQIANGSEESAQKSHKYFFISKSWCLIFWFLWLDWKNASISRMLIVIKWKH